MEILLLGTGGADGVPALWGNTRVDKYAREHRGRDIRTRAAALVDGSLKIDLPPDTLTQIQREGLDARDWSGLLFTHGDADHFAPRELQYGLAPFNEMLYLDFTIYGNETTIHRIKELYPEWPMNLQVIHAGQTFSHCDFQVTPVPAHHQETEECLNLIIQREGKTLLYATDTGIWREPAWEILAGYRVDCLVMECTEGLADTTWEGHLDLKEFLCVMNRLRTMGVLHAHSIVTSTHHSHTGNATYAELEEAMRPHGIQPGYDGMRIVI
jgi:phosphoribosyl 1,2-cyclic phosphate phosphodiesterase